MHRVPKRLSRRTAPLLAAGALLASLWGGTSTAQAATAPLPSSAITASASGHHHDDWDDDYDEDWDDYYGDDDDLEDYPYCDRRGNGYGCPEYGYPPHH